MEYLLQHPKYLQKRTLECQNRSNNSNCEVVFSAAETFISLLNEHNSDPQAFGLKILNAQIKLATTKEMILSTEAQYNLIVKRKSSLSEQAALKATLTNLQKNYNEQKNQIKRLLAIVSATTVE